MRSRRRSRILAASAALAALALTGCGGDDTPTASAGEDSPSASAENDSPKGMADRATGTGSTTEPMSIKNCGVDVTVGSPPERAVTMNQAATEVLLALGLEDQMAGTAYLDDEILPELADAYAEVPVLSDEYPSPEALLDVEPDAVYAAYPSAFDPESAGERAELAGLDITTYLSPSACPDKPKDEPLGIETVWQEISEVGEVFGATATAEALVKEQRSELDEAIESAGDLSSTTVMWWDDGTDAPSVGACCGAPGMIMDAAGVKNAFADVTGSWAEVSWEQVAERAPDVVILVDAGWSTAEDKREAIESTPGVRDLPAVKDGKFVTIPFSATTPGVRNVGAVVDLITEVEALR